MVWDWKGLVLPLLICWGLAFGLSRVAVVSCEGVIWMLLVPLGLVLVAWMDIWLGVLCGLLRNENVIWSLQILHDFVGTELK